MNRSEQINELATALSKAQGELPTLQKRSQAYNYKYADLAEIMDAIREPLAKNGLSLVSQIEWNDFPRLCTTLMHCSGQWMSVDIRLMYKADGKVNEMQAMGSSLTYARRYAISCLLNLAADKESDDDAEKSSPKTEEVKATPSFPSKRQDKEEDPKKLAPWAVGILRKLCAADLNRESYVMEGYGSYEDVPINIFYELKKRWEFNEPSKNLVGSL